MLKDIYISCSIAIFAHASRFLLHVDGIVEDIALGRCCWCVGIAAAIVTEWRDYCVWYMRYLTAHISGLPPFSTIVQNF